MRVTVRLTKQGESGVLTIGDASFPVSSRVRTLKDGTRKSSEVIRSIYDDKPYDPRSFPPGLWKITAVEWQKEKNFDPRTYGPVKIRTDTWQYVNVWDLDDDGDYKRETPRKVKDWCYHLHHSAYNTTCGCIKIEKSFDAEKIGKILADALARGEEIPLEVTYA